MEEVDAMFTAAIVFEWLAIPDILLIVLWPFTIFLLIIGGATEISQIYFVAFMWQMGVLFIQLMFFLLRLIAWILYTIGILEIND